VDDRELLDKTIKDRRAFAQIYRRYIDKIYKYCFFKLNYNKEEAEDITSQTFMIILEKIEGITLDTSHNYSLLPYIYTVARNLIIKQWEKAGKTASLDEKLTDIIPDKVDMEDEIFNQLSAEEILEKLKDIDEQTKDIIFMKIYEGYKFNEISNLLAMSESAVKMRYYRAIELVTNTIKKELNNNK